MKGHLSSRSFKAMRIAMTIIDHVHPYVQKKADLFGIKRGMTVVDYGCGPGRYSVEFARLVGENGKVLAVDLVELALRETEERAAKRGCKNIQTYLAQGYNSGIASNSADIVFAIDMFHFIQNPDVFLKELYRIAKDDGLLILSGGHQTRAAIKSKIAESGLWTISADNKGFITYKKSLLA